MMISSGWIMLGFTFPCCLYCLLALSGAAAICGYRCLRPGALQVPLAREAGSAGIFLLPASCFPYLAIVVLNLVLLLRSNLL